MKIVCSQTELNAAIQLVSRAVSTRPTHPVLANVLLTADAGMDRLTLTGFDLNLGIQTALPASVESSGAITLPARLLGEIISKLSVESPITLTIEDDSEQIEITSLGGSYQMRGMPADDFPELPLVETETSIKIKASSLAQALKATLFSSSSDEAKQVLTGVHLSFDGDSMEAAATDGHRLSVLNIKNALNSESDSGDHFSETNENFSVTLPSKSLREVERIMSTWKADDLVSLFFDRGQVVFLGENQIVTSRTLEGVYPNYRELIPNEFSKILNLDRKNFISALERVAVLADQHNNVVKITSEPSNESIIITADAQDVGSGSESIHGILKGDQVQIAFNVRYVLDGLKAIDSDTVFLRCNSATTPATISPQEESNIFTYLVMPVQVRT